MSAFSLRRCLAILLLALALPALSGCDLRVLRVFIPDFDTASVDGIHVWRLDDATGSPIIQGQLLFEGRTRQGDGELVHYEIVLADGTPIGSASAALQRNDTNPDAVYLDLLYTPAQSGWYKVSTFNEVGSSPLSITQTYL